MKTLRKYLRTLALIQGKNAAQTLAAAILWVLLGSYAFLLLRYLVVNVFHEKMNIGLLIGGGIAPVVFGVLRLLADAQEKFESFQERLDGIEERVHRNEELLLRLDSKVEVLTQMEATNARVDRLVEKVEALALKTEC